MMHIQYPPVVSILLLRFIGIHLRHVDKFCEFHKTSTYKKITPN